MGPAAKTEKTASVLLEAVFVAAVIVLLRGYVWPTLSSVEVSVLQAKLDPALFTRDFVVQESLQFTPRFYYNALILLLARAGLPLAAAFGVWQFVAVGAIATGLRAVARELGLGATAAAALVVWMLTVSVGTLGDVYFYTHAPVPAVWAGAAVAWGAVFALRGRWRLAFALLSAAALLQFLVGFYAGVLALPVWWFLAKGRDPVAPALWALGLALVYVPMRLSGGTGSGMLSAEEFVTIYAQLRHPHHLVPSTWSWAFWLQSALFYGGAWWFLCKHPGNRTATENFVLNTTILLVVAALAANWLFVEVWPTAWMATLQPARITPLAQGIVLALLARRVHARAVERDWAGAALLGLIPLSLFLGFLLVVAAALPLPARKRWSAYHAVLAVAVLLAFQPFDPSIAARGLRYGLWLALFVALVGTAWFAAKPGRLALATALALVGLGGAARASRSPSWPVFLQDRFAVDASPTGPEGRLGARFNSNSPADTVVLTPPSENAWLFRLHARRASVVEDKDFPFTERGMLTWRDRMSRVLGKKVMPGLDLTSAWAARSPAELAAIAKEFGADYILTRDVWHPQLPGVPVDRDQGWTLWRLR